MTNDQHLTSSAYFHNAIFGAFALLVLGPLWLVREHLIIGDYIYLSIPLSIGLLYFSLVLIIIKKSYLSKWYWKCTFIFEGAALGVACFTKWSVESKVNESLIWFAIFILLAIINLSADYNYRTLNEPQQ